MNPCGNSKKLSGPFSSVDEYECLGHNNTHAAIKKKEGISTFAKVMLGILAGVVVVGATAAVTYAVVQHMERKKYEACKKCRGMLDCKMEEVFSGESKKSIAALDAAKEVLKKEHSGC